MIVGLSAPQLIIVASCYLRWSSNICTTKTAFRICKIQLIVFVFLKTGVYSYRVTVYPGTMGRQDYFYSNVAFNNGELTNHAI